MASTDPHRRAWWVAALLVAAAGPIMDAGFPSQNVWPMTLLGAGLVLVAVRGQRVVVGTVLGFGAGVSFYLVQISWAGEYLGPIPWLALTVTESLFWGLFGGLAAWSYRVIPRALPGGWGRFVVLPMTVAGLWVGREEFAGAWPYGGFSWGRVAMSQSEGPFAPVVSWGGMAGLSFVLVLLVAVTVELLAERVRPPRVAVVLAAGVAVLSAVPLFPVDSTRTARIGAVQGNGPAGYFADRSPGDLLAAQTVASESLIGAGVDAVVWPENASEFDPLSSASAMGDLQELAAAFGAPFTLGTITERDGRYYNSTLAIDPVDGVTDVYDKKHPVPFGEYVPDRGFWEKLAPDLIGLIQREYVPGERDGILRLGQVVAGSAICFDITDDRVMRSLVVDGAELILAQSNNADFGRTDESLQQLAIARLRAMELGRSVVNISTVGTSAIITPAGKTLAQLEPFTAGVMVKDVPTSSSITPAAVLGGPIALLLSVGPLLVLIGAAAGTVSWQRPSSRVRDR